MMKLVIFLLISLLSCVNGSAENPAEPSRALVGFLSRANGVFTTGKITTCNQLRQPDYGNATIVRFRSSDVPSLYPAWGIYYSAERNGEILTDQILAVTEDEDGSIHVTPYGFRCRSSRIQGQRDTSHLMSLTLDDLRRRDDCEAVLARQETKAFSGPWPSCRTEVKLNTPVYQSSFTCNSWQLRGLVPSFNFRRVPSCGRFPLLPYMQDGPKTS